MAVIIALSVTVGCAHSSPINLGVYPNGSTCGYADDQLAWALDAPIDIATLRALGNVGHGLDGEISRTSDSTGIVTLARVPGERAAHRLGTDGHVACAV